MLSEEITYKGRARVPTPKISKQVQEKKVTEEYLKDLPARYKVRNFYLPSEVEEHNCPNDCWVSLFNQVFDLTKLLFENCDSELCDPIVLAAGTDITHWFDPITREPKTFIDPKTNLKTYYTPTGRYLHIPS